MGTRMTIFLDQFEAEKVAAVEAMRLKTIEECAAIAQSYWVDYPFGRIADADIASGLCEGIADAIAALKDAKP